MTTKPIIEERPELGPDDCRGCVFHLGDRPEHGPRYAIFNGEEVSCRDMPCMDRRVIYVEKTPGDKVVPAPIAGAAGGMKFDGGKRRWTLLTKGCARALGAVVDVLGFGAAKYAADSWQTVPQARERYHDALLRHLDSIARNGFTARDPETGYLEWAHVACNALFLCTFAVLDSEFASIDSEGAE